MQVQVNTDNHISGTADFAGYVEGELESALMRFGERITRVEVHFTDENSRQKSGGNDQRCLLEARLTGLKPITASAEGSTREQALSGAADKLVSVLDRILSRRDDPKGRTSFAGDPTP